MEPQVVVLMNQTKEEVEKLLEKDPLLKCKAKLTHDDCSVEDMPVINNVRGKVSFNKNLTEFALWRKLSGVRQGEEGELENPETFSVIEGLMDILVLKLGKEFPNLKFAWSKNWNPGLTINDCMTQITIEKLNLTYQGLLALVDDTNAQSIVVSIISKKIRALFV